MDFACLEDWDALPDGAAALFAEAERRSIFLSRPWLETLAETALEDGWSPRLACAVEDGAVRALLPLASGPDGVWRSLGNHFTSNTSVLVADSGRDAALDGLARGLRRLPIRDLRLEPFAPDDGTMHDLQRALESAGFRCHQRFRFHNWVLEPEGRSFGQYMAGRPSRLQNTIARKRRKLDRERDWAIRLVTTQGAGLDRAAADYHAVFDASWKATERFKGFFDLLMRRLAGQGWLRLGLLDIDGRPAAAQFWIVAHGKASIFRLAYDEAWKAWSPGTILTAQMMEHVIDRDRATEVDFLTGNDAYKRDWMSHRRERWALGCANPAPAPRAGLLGTVLRRLRTGH